MSRYRLLALCLALCFTVDPVSIPAEEPAAKPKSKFRFLVAKVVMGLTEDRGIQTMCETELSYPHL